MDDAHSRNFIFSLVLLLIASLDRPESSFITVSQQPLVELRASMEQSVTPAATLVDPQKESISTQEARQLAEEAYIFAYSMLENYKTMYAQAVNENLPAFGATFNHFSHRRQLLDPEFTIDGVRRTDGRYLFLLSRIAAKGAEDLPAVHALQDQYTLTPLSAYLGRPTPEPAHTPAFPAYDPERAASPGLACSPERLLIPRPGQNILDGKWKPSAIERAREVGGKDVDGLLSTPDHASD